MQVYTNQLFKLSMGALDGEIGSLKDLYFDDKGWIVRYLVAETGSWLFQRKVLIAPMAVDQPVSIVNNSISLKLSKEQVKNSPDIDTELPVSLQQESSLFDHYSWPSFGRAGMGWPTTGMLKGTSALINKLEQKDDFDPHLRSFAHVSKYEVHTAIGPVGVMKDLVIDLSDWSIPQFVLEGLDPNDNKSRLVPTSKIVSIDWETFQIEVSPFES